MIGSWDASNALSTKPMKSGTTLPAACSAGEAFFKTDAASGQNIYLCNPDNSWTQVTAGGGSAPVLKALIFDGSTVLSGETMSAWSCGSGSASGCTTQWTVPAGVNWIRVQAWAGGGGGGGSRHDDRGGSGGGGGGYWETTCATTPGAQVAVTVGSGGVGSSDGYAAAGAGGISSFGSCISVLGGDGGNGSLTMAWGGRLSGSNRIGWFNQTGTIANPTLTGCAGFAGSPGYGTGRSDAGACAGGTISSQGAGQAGGTALSGGAGGGSGGYNNDTGGVGGTSALGNLAYTNGGNGGKGGGWTSGTGLTACAAGIAPGGGGGGAGVMVGGSNQSGCNGARGEVRVYYVH